MEVPINYLAVLVSAASAIVLGMLWYGPLFGKTWMREVGFTADEIGKAKNDPMAKRAMLRSYLLMAVASLLMAYVFAHSLVFASYYLDMDGAGSGLTAAFLSWLGFVVPPTVAMVLWEKKTWKYWFITAGYYLVALGIMGVILSVWL